MPILYGYPSPRAFAEAEAGRISLGGCMIEPDAPDFACPRCDAPLPSGDESPVVDERRTVDPMDGMRGSRRT